MPTVINRHHYKSRAEFPKPWVYIGRGTPLGNPFTLKSHGRTGALDQYRRWLWEKIKACDPQVIAALDAITEDHHLVCSCAPLPCHGDVVVRAWEYLHGRTPSNPPANTEPSTTSPTTP